MEACWTETHTEQVALLCCPVLLLPLALATAEEGDHAPLETSLLLIGLAGPLLAKV